MSKPVLEKQEVAAQIEAAAEQYAAIKKNTNNEIARIKQQLLDIGVTGSTIVKLQPVWQPDVTYLLRKEAENPGDQMSKKQDKAVDSDATESLPAIESDTTILQEMVCKKMN